MKLNNRGFVLLETLVVAIFIVSIFTFLYVSVIPLLGTYDDLNNKANIDIVYKLYHIRKALYQDDNFLTMTSLDNGIITCQNFTIPSKCQKLLTMLDLDESNYQLLYVRDGSYNTLKNNNELSEELKEYIEPNGSTIIKNKLYLLDGTNHLVSDLRLAINPDSPYVYE